MAGNEALSNRNRDPRDEFYTQLVDVEKELRHYRDQFEGKVVFCNCDDPYESSFFKYFAMNFNHLGLKKLIATCYSGSPIAGDQLSLLDLPSLVLQATEKQAYKVEISEVPDGMVDDDVTRRKGIYQYVLTGGEKYLAIRAFTPAMRRAAYERQSGVCPKCKKHFEIDEMEADHIDPWSKGGKTNAANCKMLCLEDNRRKGAI